MVDIVRFLRMYESIKVGLSEWSLDNQFRLRKKRLVWICGLEDMDLVVICDKQEILVLGERSLTV